VSIRRDFDVNINIYGLLCFRDRIKELGGRYETSYSIETGSTIRREKRLTGFTFDPAIDVHKYSRTVRMVKLKQKTDLGRVGSIFSSLRKTNAPSTWTGTNRLN